MPRASRTGSRPCSAAKRAKASVEFTSSDTSTPPGRSAGQPALNSNHMHSNECSLSCMNVSIAPSRSSSGGSSSWLRPEHERPALLQIGRDQPAGLGARPGCPRAPPLRRTCPARSPGPLRAVGRSSADAPRRSPAAQGARTRSRTRSRPRSPRRSSVAPCGGRRRDRRPPCSRSHRGSGPRRSRRLPRGARALSRADDPSGRSPAPRARSPRARLGRRESAPLRRECVARSAARRGWRTSRTAR